MHKRFFCFLLIFVIIFNLFSVNVQAIPASPYDENYTWEEYMEDSVNEAAKFLAFLLTGCGAVFNGNYTEFMKSCQLYSETFGTGEWVHVDSSGNVTYDQELVDFLKQFISDYAQQHPEEVEEINYILVKTNTQTGAILGDLSLKTAFTLHEGESVNVTDGYSELDRFRLIWQLQSEYEEFPELYYISYLGNLPADSEKVQSVNFNQYLRFFRGYEHNRVDATKVSCFIGGLDANSMACTFGLYTYDYSLGTLENDRVQGVLQQYSGTYATGEWTLTTGYRSPNAESSPARALRFSVDVDIDSGLITIPSLITQDGKIYRMFATEQDALRYFETCADSGLNFDPNQVYTGGSVTINNNGDVIINNNPPGGDEEPGGDSSGILGVLQDIRDWVKKIYNQVVIGNVIDAVNALANVLDTLKNYLDEIAGDATAIAELGEELVTKFPFSLPRDILLVVTLFEAEPVAPVWEIPFRADFGGPTGIKVDETFTIDFTDFQDAVDVLKWFLSLVWLFGLAMLTPKVLGTGGISSKGD